MQHVVAMKPFDGVVRRKMAIANLLNAQDGDEVRSETSTPVTSMGNATCMFTQEKKGEEKTGTTPAKISLNGALLLPTLNLRDCVYRYLSMPSSSWADLWGAHVALSI